MSLESHDAFLSAARTESETAVAVAERGLDSWRAAKVAWLDSFSEFAAQEANAGPLAGVSAPL